MKQRQREHPGLSRAGAVGSASRSLSLEAAGSGQRLCCPWRAGAAPGKTQDKPAGRRPNPRLPRGSAVGNGKQRGWKGASRVAQWLRIRLTTQRTRVGSLVGRLRSNVPQSN